MFIFLLAISLSGCAHRPINEPLAQATSRNGYYFQTHPRPSNSDELLILLAFSGGGTRAAALAYGILQELRKSRFISEGQDRRDWMKLTPSAAFPEEVSLRPPTVCTGMNFFRPSRTPS